MNENLKLLSKNAIILGESVAKTAKEINRNFRRLASKGSD